MRKNMLALMAMILVLSSCNSVKEEPSDDTHSVTQEPSTEMQMEYIPPAADYGGESFRVIARGTGKWACQDMYSEGYNGETINDTIYERNTYAEDLLNFTIEQELVDQDAELFRRITTFVQAGENAYDLVWVGSAEIAKLAMNGMLQDMGAIETLDFSHSWWDPKAVENLTINDAIYFTTGEISVISKYAVYVITFNKSSQRNMICRIFTPWYGKVNGQLKILECFQKWSVEI